MNTYDILKKLSKEKKISIRQLEIKFNYSNGYLAKWKNNTPNSDELVKLADYFNVSTDYLLGRTQQPNHQKTERKPNFTIDEALDGLMSYDGKTLTEHDRDVLRGIFEGYLKNK